MLSETDALLCAGMLSGLMDPDLGKPIYVAPRVNAAIAALRGERPSDATRPCERCDGCGRIANSDDGEAWTAWQDLPPPSDLAVRMGLVKPIPCPICGGSGKRGPTDPAKEATRSDA